MKAAPEGRAKNVNKEAPSSSIRFKSKDNKPEQKSVDDHTIGRGFQLSIKFCLVGSSD